MDTKENAVAKRWLACTLATLAGGLASGVPEAQGKNSYYISKGLAQSVVRQHLHHDVGYWRTYAICRPSKRNPERYGNTKLHHKWTCVGKGYTRNYYARCLAAYLIRGSDSPANDFTYQKLYQVDGSCPYGF